MGLVQTPLSVFDLDEDGFVEHEGETMVIEEFAVDNEMVKIESVMTAETAPGFNYKMRNMGCACKKIVGLDMITLLARRHYIGPCYKCEKWNSWVRSRKRSLYELYKEGLDL